MIPSATYSYPQVASFGLSEKEALEAGKQIKKGKFPFRPMEKRLALAKAHGFVKVIVDAKYGEILGAHMIGPEVSELLPELSLAQQSELTVEELASNSIPIPPSAKPSWKRGRCPWACHSYLVQRSF